MHSRRQTSPTTMQLFQKYNMFILKLAMKATCIVYRLSRSMSTLFAAYWSACMSSYNMYYSQQERALVMIVSMSMQFTNFIHCLQQAEDAILGSSRSIVQAHGLIVAYDLSGDVLENLLSVIKFLILNRNIFRLCQPVASRHTIRLTIPSVLICLY